MRKLLVGLGVVAAILVGVVAAGYLLPREHRVSSRIVVQRPPDSVWSVVRNLDGLADVWDGIREVRRERSPEGSDVWVQTMADGSEIRIMISEHEPPRRLVTDIVAGEDAPFGGRWIYELEPDARGTAVTLTEDGWVANPLFRLVTYVTGYYGTLDAYLTALGQRFGDTVTPVHLQ